MKTKNRSASQLYTTKPTSRKIAPSLQESKHKQQMNKAKQSKMTKKEERKEQKIYDKQNIQSSNLPSPQNILRGKNYKPKLKKTNRLQLSQNTVSVIINESSGSGKKKDLLQSLLYGDIDLSYAHDLNLKEQDADQLLIDCCEKSHQLKIYKNLSPIKSISEYSVTQNQNQTLVAQKIDNGTSNILIRVNNKDNHGKINKIIDSVLLRRLLLHFHEKSEAILNFYSAIHKVFTKKQLLIKIREYLFKNSIIFNKNQLAELMDTIDKTIVDSKINSNHEEMCEQKIQVVMRLLFLHLNPQNEELTCYIWVSQDVLERLFYQKDMVSIWRLVEQICADSHKQIESSFRQSRFCLSLDSSQFIHETDEKRKKQNMELVCKWLSNYIKIPGVGGKTQTNKQEIKINIIPAWQ